MDPRYSAFSFVDRITAEEPGVSVEGTFFIPDHLPAFPQLLMVEAVGQLAAWSAMARLGYRLRPVAGLGQRLDLLGSPRPGQVLHLAARFESLDEQAVAYSGTASVDGVEVVQLHHCVGPMLPLEDFDAPEAVEGQYRLLRAAGAEPGRLRELAGVEPEVLEAGPRSLKARLQVPRDAAFFPDHFPRRPVFPATLLLQSASSLGARLSPDGAPYRVAACSSVKQRTFLDPGDPVDVEITLGRENVALASIRREGRPVGAARLHLERSDA